MSELLIARLDTAAGPMLAALTARGLAALERGDDATDFVAAVTRRFPKIDLRDGRAADLERQLDEYLAGRRRCFDVAVDLRDLAPFNRRALEATMAIPYGETATYGELAAQLGHPGAARAVGNALSRCPVSIVVPCHRVVRASDGLSGWGADVAEKRRLLALEREAVARA